MCCGICTGGWHQQRGRKERPRTELHKTTASGWTGDSGLGNTCRSCRGPTRQTQACTAPVPKDLVLSSDFREHQVYTQYTYILASKIFIHLKIQPPPRRLRQDYKFEDSVSYNKILPQLSRFRMQIQTIPPITSGLNYVDQEDAKDRE